MDDESPFSPSHHQSGQPDAHSYLVQVVFLSSIISSVMEKLHPAGL